MLKAKKNLLFFIMFLTVFLMPAKASEIFLDSFVSTNSFIFRWMPVMDTGELKYGSDVFTFRVGEDFIIYNYKEKIPGTKIYRDNGSIKLDNKTSEIILKKTGFSVKPEEPDKTTATRPSGHRIAAVLIDPGHGGRDPGAIGRHQIDGKEYKIDEKDIVLEIALELNKKLASRYRDKKIILTRNSDKYLSLEESVEMANSVKLGPNEAIVFVSIHANASFNTKARGFEVWYLPPDYRRDLIDSDSIDNNKKDLIPILNTMLEEEFTIESILLAQNILDSMDESVGNREYNRGLKEETWFVVRNAKMPSVLIEVGFVSNREEALKLSDRQYLKKISDGIYNGISSFIDSIELINVNGER